MRYVPRFWAHFVTLYIKKNCIFYDVLSLLTICTRLEATMSEWVIWYYVPPSVLNVIILSLLVVGCFVVVVCEVEVIGLPIELVDAVISSVVAILVVPYNMRCMSCHVISNNIIQYSYHIIKMEQYQRTSCMN